MTDYAAAVLRRGSAVLVRREDGAPRLPSAPLEASADAANDRPDADGESNDAAADPAAAARRAASALGLDLGALDHVRTGSQIRDGEDTYAPVLFDVAGDAAATADDAEWIAPTALLHESASPSDWYRYQRVAPTVRSIAADGEHGAAYLSVRALEVLRDRAALQVSEDDPDLDELTDLGDRVLSARPSMAVLENRVNRVLAVAVDGDDVIGEDGTDDAAEGVAGAVEAAADAGIDRALRADADAAAAAADLLDDAGVLTLSRSGTVLDALRSASPRSVHVAESRPAREGISVAEELAAALDAPVTVLADAAVAHALATEDVDAVVVGADAVLPDGRVVNKTGTRTAALAAAREGIPVYAVAASDKITRRETVNLETGDATAIYDGDAELDVLNPTFDVTPGDLVDAVVTERGRLGAEDVAAIAEEHGALTAWRD
ncbi:translation initiation factor eIF-2B [Natronoarchaeum rubrum]|uniref:translation initiation factor eIF-2B n=1 Tax=Natronoarchaeum rubrum TaxID=755311 RepID=UPI0021126859|nr:initiation factor 2B [Natronoarchaeum rubrum]